MPTLAETIRQRSTLVGAFAEALRPTPGDGPNLQSLNEALSQEAATVELLQERIAELELAQDDAGWTKLSEEGGTEFSREALMRIVHEARIMYLKNPLIQRAVEIRSYYIWGQGVEIDARSDQVDVVVQKFMADPGNRKVLFRHQAHTDRERDLELDGNLFFALFTNRLTGRVQVRTVPVDEVVDIITNPEDRMEVWYYKREWDATLTDPATGRSTTERMCVYYPDVLYRPARNARPSRIGNKEVRWDAPIYHVKVGSLSTSRYGVPEVYAALDWAKAYKTFLEDWASIVRSLARFAWTMVTKGSKVGAAKTKLGTTVNTGNAGGRETNPSPTTGSVFVADEGTSLMPVSRGGATTDAEDAKQLRLMVAAAMHLPDTILSADVQQGALATARTLDRPTELAMRDRQLLWTDVLRDIFTYVVEKAVEAKRSGLNGTVTEEDGQTIVTLTGTDEEADPTVDVTFPDILEHDLAERVSAIVDAATLKGKADAHTIPSETLIRMILVTLGVEDVEELVEVAMAEREEAERKAEEMVARAASEIGADADDAEATEAYRDLIGAVGRLREAIVAGG